ncbi:MAG: decaprenyl-phosphate phosphoribosyltransferase [Sulfurospirillaceae bacterium]|nr:decaprenyl-phosphate phosphoribosyltransferase [Sulfurospirillaceae bacterium]
MKKIQALWLLSRPHQWIKNLFLFAPLFFTFDITLEQTLSVLTGFLIFSITASSIYIFNDFYDVEEDKIHPTKRNRPIASGQVSKKSAIVFGSLLLCLALSAAFGLKQSFTLILLLYVILNISYTIKLKHIPILDISIIACGFVLRIFAGAAIIDVSPSMWIVLVTFLLALFLALAKRRDDVLLALEGKKARKNIDGYNLEMLNASMTLMASVTILSYIMYTVSPEVTNRLGTHNLYLTAFFVMIGMLRYMQLTFVEQKSGSPTMIVLKDRFLQSVILGWISLFYIIVKVSSC